MLDLSSTLCYLIFSASIISCANRDNDKKLIQDNKILNDTSSTNFMDVEQAVIINFQYGIQGLDSLYKLEDKLEEVIEKNKLGEYDGNEVAVDYSDGTLFMYGQSAEKIFDAIKPILNKTSFMKGAKVTLRFGPPREGVKETVVTI